MNRKAHDADKSAASLQRQDQAPREDTLGEEGNLLGEDDSGQDFDNGDALQERRSPLFSLDGRPEAVGEQAEFREQFDEELYTDREDQPAQGNTADIAMGEQRFGSEAEAYTEYAYRRPGDHRRGDESAVGQARDPADIADDDEHA